MLVMNFGLVQRSNFSCAESNANHVKGFCTRFGNMKSSTFEQYALATILLLQ